MDMGEIVESIKSDLGGDVVSLGIRDETIESKVKEALRKVGAYSPRVLTESFPVANEKLIMPEGTIAVQSVLSSRDPSDLKRGDDEIDIFNINNFILGSSPDTDPMSYLIRKTELDTMMRFIEVTDWYYVPDNRTIFFNYYNRPSATIKYLKKYTDVSEVIKDDELDAIKNYALALCKIAEGNLRRKLAQTPGSMLLDGSELVQEGKEEKAQIEEQLKKEFSNMRFGIRA